MTGRYAIIELPESGPVPPEAIAVGSLDDVFEFIPQSCAREERGRALDEREAKATAREAQIAVASDAIQQILQDLVPSLLGHLDGFVGEREQQHRQDAERAAEAQQLAEDEAQRSRIRDAVRALDDNPDSWGELTATHSPSEEAHEEELAAGDGDGDQGDLPEPLELGTEPEVSHSRPSVARNPATIGST
jgi:hypothetical protein